MSHSAPPDQGVTTPPEDVPLFDGYEPPFVEEEPKLSADQRRTKRQSDQIAIGVHPLTGTKIHELASRHRDATAPKDDPFTCGSCYFRESMGYHGKSYAKCVRDVNGRHPFVTHSAATDVRAWWPACPYYSPSDRISPDAARFVPTEESA